MRRFLPFALLALALAVPLHAAEAPNDLADPVAVVAPPAVPAANVTPVVADEPQTPAMRLDPVRVEVRVAAEASDAAQFPQRGSFWWLVGVIVVAGVILAVLLD